MRWWVAYALEQKIFTYTEIMEIKPQRFFDILDQISFLYPKIVKKEINAEYINERRKNAKR